MKQMKIAKMSTQAEDALLSGGSTLSTMIRQDIITELLEIGYIGKKRGLTDKGWAAKQILVSQKEEELFGAW